MLLIFVKRICIISAFIFISSFAAFADGGNVRKRISSEFTIRYVFDKTNIDETYMGNKAQMDSIRNFVSRIETLDSIVIYSWASPEGGYRHNVDLAVKRGETARDFLLATFEEYGKDAPERIDLEPLAENWQGLTRLVEKRYRRHDRDLVLKILRDKSIGDETRKWRLQQLDDGYTWDFLWRIYMPELRAATWICVWAEVIEPMPQVQACQHRLQSAPGSIIMPQETTTGYKDSRTILGLKTNLLYDAVTAVNYAVEIPFNEKFSLQLQQHTPWWLSKSNKHCLQFLTGGAEFRWWFLPQTSGETADRKQRDALTGHFLGAYGWGGIADIQWGRNFGCYQFDFFSAGLTYGYSMPVSKYLNLEFSISAGYANIPYQHYIPTDDWQILIRDKNNAGTLHYFGPTKAEISLVIPIRANINRKGGAR